MNEYHYDSSDQLHADELTTAEKLKYALAGLVIAGGAVVIARNMILKARAMNEQRRTLSEGSAPTIAKQIRMAFQNDGWPGTDKEALRLAFRSIPSKTDFKRVVDSYQKLYQSSLLADMQQELKSTEYNELLYIVSSKPDTASGDQQGVTVAHIQGWAKRLRTAFDMSYGPFPGTDEEAIRAVFIEIPTQTAFMQVADVYRVLFGGELAADLKSELEVWEYGPMMQLIYNKPKS